MNGLGKSLVYFGIFTGFLQSQTVFANTFHISVPWGNGNGEMFIETIIVQKNYIGAGTTMTHMGRRDVYAAVMLPISGGRKCKSAKFLGRSNENEAVCATFRNTGDGFFVEITKSHDFGMDKPYTEAIAFRFNMDCHVTVETASINDRAVNTGEPSCHH